MGKLIYEEESYRIRGAIFEVYKEKGNGFLEPVYHECLGIELGLSKIPFLDRQPLTLSYKGHPLTQTYIPDFICFDRIIVELKAVKELNNDHRAQVFNCLKATKLRLGFLVNFCSYPEVTIERIVFGKDEQI